MKCFEILGPVIRPWHNVAVLTFDILFVLFPGGLLCSCWFILSHCCSLLMLFVHVPKGFTFTAHWCIWLVCSSCRHFEEVHSPAWSSYLSQKLDVDWQLFVCVDGIDLIYKWKSTIFFSYCSVVRTHFTDSGYNCRIIVVLQRMWQMNYSAPSLLKPWRVITVYFIQ